jgi:hypothetical protein
VDNIRHLATKKIPKGIVPVQLPDGLETADEPTILQYIVAQALAPSAPVPSTAMKNAMVELGRMIVAVMRCLRLPQNVNEFLERRIFETPLLARPVARLVRQRFFPEARSEGLLGLGLMAQTRQGAVAVLGEFKADKGLLEAVKDFAVVDEKKEEQAEVSLGRDHQNALVLVHALGANGVSLVHICCGNDATNGVVARCDGWEVEG